MSSKINLSGDMTLKRYNQMKKQAQKTKKKNHLESVKE
jgi:hypothetical protein